MTLAQELYMLNGTRYALYILNERMKFCLGKVYYRVHTGQAAVAARGKVGRRAATADEQFAGGDT